MYAKWNFLVSQNIIKSEFEIHNLSVISRWTVIGSEAMIENHYKLIAINHAFFLVSPCASM